MELRVVSSALDADDLNGLVGAATAPLRESTELRRPASGFLEGLDAQVVVALLSGATTVTVTLIKSLFDLWRDRKRSGSESRTPVVIVRTTTKRLRIARDGDLPTPDELAGEIVEEIRLDLSD